MDLIPKKRLEGARQVLEVYADMLEEDTVSLSLSLLFSLSLSLTLSLSDFVSFLLFSFLFFAEQEKADPEGGRGAA